MAPKKDGAFKNECPRTAIVPIFLTRAVDVPVELCLDGRLATMLVATINIIIFSHFFLLLCRLLFSLKEYSDNTSLAAKGALTHRLQRLKNPIWPPGSGNVSTSRFLGILSNFR